MRFLKLIYNTLVFTAVVSMVLSPVSNVFATTPIVYHEFSGCDLPGSSQLEDPVLSYDDVLNFIESIENGDLGGCYSFEDNKRLNRFLAHLAREGILQNNFEEKWSIEDDIQDLLIEDCSFEYACPFDSQDNYLIIPSIAYNRGNIELCKGGVSKQWKQTKKFVKKHKKAIIIGAVVLIATGVVIGIVAASSTGAVAGAAAGLSGTDEKRPNSISNNSSGEAIASTAPPVTNNADSFSVNSTLNNAVGDHVTAFKEYAAKENLFDASSISRGPREYSFQEKARYFGSYLAHETLNSVAQITSFVPELAEEVKSITPTFLPQDQCNNMSIQGAPKENYDNWITAGHQKIDKVFSTDQSFSYTPEGKANSWKNKLTIGMVPPPGAFIGTNLNVSKLIDAGKVMDRAGFTKAGRHSMKHGYRPGSSFPKPLGNPDQINMQGQEILESILNHPEKIVKVRSTKMYGHIVEIKIPGKMGVRYTIEGEFIGFLEP